MASGAAGMEGRIRKRQLEEDWEEIFCCSITLKIVLEHIPNTPSRQRSVLVHAQCFAHLYPNFHTLFRVLSPQSDGKDIMTALPPRAGTQSILYLYSARRCLTRSARLTAKPTSAGTHVAPSRCTPTPRSAFPAILHCTLLDHPCLDDIT